MAQFTPVDPRASVDAQEREIQKFWETQEIFRKSVDGEDGECRKGRERYTFYDGPPFATGLPHYGHLVGGTLKDVVPRYQTMRGKRVERRWGWDCHGLPIENIVEKELGSKSKKDIEAIGVETFNETCRSKVLAYASEWERIVPRLGRWVDMSQPYRTMDRDYMESVWWVFKRLYDKGLVYESYRSMHICPRCETTLSQSEVSEGYADVKDLSVIAKFELVDEPNTFILAWTTTPWTLPGNVALAVGKDIAYVRVRSGDAEYIVATKLVENVFDGMEYEVIAEMSGNDLVGKAYVPLYDYYASQEGLENRENGWMVYAADFVTTEDGTGVVHIAPAFGEDDMALGKTYDLPFVQHVGMDGILRPEIGEPLGGADVKPRAKGRADDVREVDIAVVKDLAHRHRLFRKEKYTHSYPHCWRCDTALLNYATSSWFVAVTKIKDQLLETAKSINWSPAHIKDGRFGKWLHGARDWSISRQRFWASVIPVWRCDQEECHAEVVFGSAAELEERSGQRVDDLHKHVVDAVTFTCTSCEAAGRHGVMHRVPDVLDTWFDSGSMPYAQEHYMGNGALVNGFPADFIAEGVDQTRAWFYYLHVLATALAVGGENHDRPSRAFTNVIVNGTVLAEDGKKMSKKLKNYPDPMEMVETYGADALRLYLMSSPVVTAEDLRFSEKDLRELSRGFFRMLRQSYGFFVLYANVDGYTPRDTMTPPSSDHLLDRWIIARLRETTEAMVRHMDAYAIRKAARAMVPFVDDLSNWYIRRSRKRFWKSEDDADKTVAYDTLHYVLVTVAKLLAPFTPFVSEHIYRNLMQGVTNAKESVHLEDYPTAEIQREDAEIIAQMERARSVISAALEQRAAASLKVRLPLAQLIVPSEVSPELFEMIAEEVNVKTVVAGDTLKLDTQVTPELAREGKAREIIRYIQQMRKHAGFDVDDRIDVGYIGGEDIFTHHADMIRHETLIPTPSALHSELLEGADATQTVDVDGESVTISIRRHS